MSAEPVDEAKKLALKFNNVMFGLFGGWLALLVMFWLRGFGPMLSYDARPLTVSVPSWFAISLVAATIAALLPRSFYRPRPFEIEGSLYRAIGIRGFRAIITDGDLINAWVRQRHPGYRVHRGPGRIVSAVESGFKAERSHHVFFWFGLGTSLCAWLGGWHGWAILIALGNVFGNFYPMLLQRYTRGRLWRLRPDLVKRTLGVGDG